MNLTEGRVLRGVSPDDASIQKAKTKKYCPKKRVEYG